VLVRLRFPVASIDFPVAIFLERLPALLDSAHPRKIYAALVWWHSRGLDNRHALLSGIPTRIVRGRGSAAADSCPRIRIHGDGRVSSDCQWILLSYGKLPKASGGFSIHPVRRWTDDYSNLLQILKK
jgi:hypothetical protein